MSLVTRRKFLGGSFLSLAAGVGAYAYGRAIESTWLEIVQLDVPLRNLPDAFADFTIAQISDMHFGAFLDVGYVDSVIGHVQAFDADVIVITGDHVSRVSHGEPEWLTEAFSRLRAREGVYAILGNHDWWENSFVVSDALRRAGVRLLSNEHIMLRRGGQTLHLAGVDDVWCGKHDLEKALRGIPPDGRIITLVHEPDYADVVARESRVLLQISGHSHGGQVRVPFCGGIWYPPWGRKYPIGLNHVSDLTVYTNRGIGMVNRPLRFACRPEVTLFTLKPES